MGTSPTEQAIRNDGAIPYASQIPNDSSASGATLKDALSSLKTGIDAIDHAMTYQGIWDCSGGVYPTPVVAGNFWICSVAGTIAGTTYAVTDWLAYNGTTWDKIDNSDLVTSVFSRTGPVVAAASDYDASQVDNDSSVAGSFVSDALNTLDAQVGATGEVVYVDNSRGDSYTEDGSRARPFKTITAAIAATIAASPDYYVTIDIASGIYRENVVLEDAALKYIKLQGHGYVSINPVAGNALQSTANNANLFALHVDNIIFSKPVVLTGGAGATSFSDVFWHNVRFTGTATLTATCINNISMSGVYSETPWTYTNVSWSYLENGQLQGTFGFTMDDTQPIPSFGKDGTVMCNGIYLSDTPGYTVGGTSTYTVVLSACRWGWQNYTVPAGVTVYANTSYIRGTVTNNGTIYLRNAFMQGYVAGTGTLTLQQPASQIGYTATPGDWNGTAPADLQEAVTRIAAEVATLKGSPI